MITGWANLDSTKSRIIAPKPQQMQSRKDRLNISMSRRRNFIKRDVTLSFDPEYPSSRNVYGVFDIRATLSKLKNCLQPPTLHLIPSPLCSLPQALCPLLYALCSLPFALCPLPLNPITASLGTDKKMTHGYPWPGAKKHWPRGDRLPWDTE